MINSGSFRSGMVHPAGNFTLGVAWVLTPEWESDFRRNLLSIKQAHALATCHTVLLPLAFVCVGPWLARGLTCILSLRWLVGHVCSDSTKPCVLCTIAHRVV